VIVAFVFHSWTIILIYALFTSLLGFFAVKYYSLYKKILGRWRLLRMVKTERKIIEELVNERAAIMEELTILKK